MAALLPYIIVGFLAGAVSGLIGIGGGVLIVPTLVLAFGFTQHNAQGTTLAMLIPPIGLLAAWTYYKNGFVNFKVAMILCIGFFVGSYLGANAASVIPTKILEKMFGVALLLISIKMLFWR